MREAVSGIVEVAGIAAIVAGVAMLTVPAAFIVAGVLAVVWAALLPTARRGPQS